MFKVGDKVRCVRGLVGGTSGGPVEGEVYKVVNVIPARIYWQGLVVNLENLYTPDLGGWFLDRFELIPEQEDDLYV